MALGFKLAYKNLDNKITLFSNENKLNTRKWKFDVPLSSI
jgi:hypothetical protein